MDTILRLRELMNSRGWSEYRLAKESKLSMSTISNIFHRGSIPSIPTLETLCNTFGISLGQFFSKGVSFKWSKQKFVCGKIMVKRKMVDLIGIEPTTLRMRTSTRNFFRVFPAVFSCFRSAPLHLWASLTMLFPCGPEQCVVGSVVRNAPSPCRRLSPTGTGSVFHASNCLHCTSVDRIKQVISVLSTAQKLRDCKQKEAFCSKRLRNLKRMFMRILHLL